MTFGLDMNEGVTIEAAEKEYISHWRLNAKQHFDDGDYKWLCNFIKNHVGDGCGIAEIGCGAGYSTLAFVQNGFDVVAIDTNSQAINATIQLLKEHQIQDCVVAEKYDAVCQMNGIKRLLNLNKFPVNVIVLCNPGGNVDAQLTEAEYKLLQLFGAKDDEISKRLSWGQIPLLHKWAQIYAACSLSMMMDKMLVIVERGDQKELESTHELIQYSAGIRKVALEFREIRHEPKGGIQLGNAASRQCWGAALYSPT